MADKPGNEFAQDVSLLDESTGSRLAITAGVASVSAASLPLPAGAATETTLAKLSIAPGTALGANTLALVGGSVTADHPTYVAGQISPLNLDLRGHLRTSTHHSLSAVSGTLAALDATVAIVVQGQPAVTFLLDGTWSGTIVVEGLADSTWVLAHVAPSSTLIASASIVSTTSSANVPYTIIPLPLNCTQYRLRMSAYTSGSVAVTIQESDGDRIMLLSGVSHGGTMRQIASVDRVLNYNVLSTVAMDFSAHEAFEKRMYSTTLEYTLPNSGTETPAFLITNPVGNTKSLVLYRIGWDVFTDGGFVRSRLYYNPTGTITGNAGAIINRNIGGGAAASTMTSLYGALSGVTGNGTRFGGLSVNSIAGILMDLHYNTILQPGNSILITGQPEANNRIFTITVIWSEISI